MKIPSDKILWYYMFMLNSSLWFHNVCCFLLHTVPACLVDCLAIMTGREPQSVLFLFLLSLIYTPTPPTIMCTFRSFLFQIGQSLQKDPQVQPRDIVLLDAAVAVPQSQRHGPVEAHESRRSQQVLLQHREPRLDGLLLLSRAGPAQVYTRGPDRDRRAREEKILPMCHRRRQQRHRRTSGMSEENQKPKKMIAAPPDEFQAQIRIEPRIVGLISTRGHPTALGAVVTGPRMVLVDHRNRPVMIESAISRRLQCMMRSSPSAGAPSQARGPSKNCYPSQPRPLAVCDHVIDGGPRQKETGTVRRTHPLLAQGLFETRSVGCQCSAEQSIFRTKQKGDRFVFSIGKLYGG
ncbi:unnamed protein product [Trichogramma brassicae]|uniref:Uncharacterized protein n=1 Tax=Trichogramma brassicae TaxID=86971 RepID=A0A6H5I0Q9_9HYME|nr:unnamed protein product [Trichogramma brassicae]